MLRESAVVQCCWCYIACFLAHEGQAIAAVILQGSAGGLMFGDL